MNQAWGSLWDMLRATSVATATGFDAAFLQDQGGVPFAGWPTNRDDWEAGYRHIAFAIRGNRDVFFNWLADVLAAYSETLTVDITASPGLDSASFDTSHQNRFVRFHQVDVLGDRRIFFTGALDGTELALASGARYWADPAADLSEFLTTAAVEFLPFVILEPHPGASEPNVYLPGIGTSSTGTPCVVEIVLLGDFPSLVEFPPYLHEDGEAWDAAAPGCVLYEDGEEDDPDAPGIYLVGEDAIPALTAPIQHAMLPAGVRVRTILGT